MLSALPPCWFIGRLDCVSGYGEAARHQLLALAKHGLRVHGWHCATTSEVKDQDTPFFRAVQECLHPPAPADVQPEWAIVHMTPDNAESFRAFLPEKQILSMVWETSRIPAYWVPLINTYVQVWVPTEWNKEVLLQSGITVPIHVVTFAFKPSALSR